MTAAKKIRVLRHKCGREFKPLTAQPRFCPGCKQPLRFPLDLKIGRLFESFTTPSAPSSLGLSIT